MPPTFLYLLFLIPWVGCACLVWLAAGLLFLDGRTRALAKRLCFAMAATFPFVLAYQLIAALVIGSLLLFLRIFWKELEPGTSSMTQNPFVIVMSIGIGLLCLVTAFAASATGFYEGWRTGWMCANGRSVREVLAKGPTMRLVRRLQGKVTNGEGTL
jgi:hypothetical protein